MKKIVLLLILVCFVSFGFASTGWYSDYILINGEGSENYYWIGSDPEYGTQFHGHDFGSVTSLTIEGCDMRYWSDTQDRTGGAFYWRIDEGTATEVIWSQVATGGNNYQGTLSGQGINVLSGLSPGQTYTLQIWAKSWGSGQPDDYLNAGGSNYIASFTTPEAPTPICLNSFVVSALKGKVELAWTTANEAENSHFLIYRDNAVIGQVAGNGTCTVPHDYNYVDDKVAPGVHSYAISDVTYGGEEVKHEAVSVEIGAALAEADFILNKAYPNPFNPSTTVKYCIEHNVYMELGVYNMQGEKVANLYNGLQTSGTHTAVWNAEGMPSGIYFVRFIAEDMLQTMKVVLMK